VDLLEVKGRIAVALVESIFRRAGFRLAPVSPREAPPRGRDEVAPHFAAVCPVPAGAPDGPGRPVEVRYRPQVGQYLAIENQRGAQSVFAHAKRAWSELVFVFVTDHPEADRSWFQVLDLGRWTPGAPAAAVDLYAHPGLDIYRHNVEEHELLARRIFALLTGSSSGTAKTREG
jgi:hypothetical protein